MEIMDIVDENDVVIGSATRSEIYDKKHWHRIAHVIIFNSAGEMALQRRSPSRSFMPNAWVSAGSGHVQAGETYEQGARRELIEEVGIDVPLTFLARDPYFALGLSKFLGTFTGVHEGPFHHDLEAVSEVGFFSLADIAAMIKNGEAFHPEFHFILQKHFDVA
jgi:isopentenyl-diphosphate delta-isomerase